MEYVLNRIYAGWQNKESKFSDDIIERIVMHEIGHAIVGFLSRSFKVIKNCFEFMVSKNTRIYYF